MRPAGSTSSRAARRTAGDLDAVDPHVEPDPGRKAACVVRSPRGRVPSSGRCRTARTEQVVAEIARPTSTASSSLASLVDSMVTSLVAPSAVGDQLRTDRRTPRRQSQRSRGAGLHAGCAVWPAGARCRCRHAASPSMRSNVVRVPRPASCPQWRDRQRRGVSTHSIVARLGRACPLPWPCRRRQPSGCATADCFETVSVVRIASAASAPRCRSVHRRQCRPGNSASIAAAHR